MDIPASIALVHEGSLQLAPQVVLGTVDVAAVGARVLMSLQPPDGWTVREVAVGIRGLEASSTVRPVLATPSETAEQAPAAAAAAAGPSDGSGRSLVVVRNFYAPGAQTAAEGEAAGSPPQVSLIILNAAVPEGEQAEVAAALVDLISSGGAEAGARTVAQGEGAEAEASPSLTLVAAMLLQHLAHPAALYQHLLSGAQPLDSGLPALAASGAATRVRDGQLAALLHVLEVSGTSARCLLAPGHKPPAATTLDLPDSAAACDALGGAVASALGWLYDAAKCRAVRATYKWFVPENSAGSDVMYM